MIARVPPRYAPERRYALEVLLGEFLGLELAVREAAVAAIELELEGRVLALPEGLFAVPEADWLTERSLPSRPLAELDGVPLLYGTPGAPDLVGSAFFCLTRYEELVRPERDVYERFPAAASLAVAEGFLGRALVDDLVELLWRRLAEAWPRLLRRPRDFAVVPSHDVDFPLAPEPRLRGAAGDVVRRRDPALALRRLRLGRLVYDTFDWTMDESERRGLRSAFYFIAGHTAPIDGDYTLDDPWIRRLLRRIHERGHEIGLHPSYGSFRDVETTRAEAETLRRALDELGVDQPELGGRQHLLRWENPVTWRNWEAAGLAYDSTVGYAERPGFRCGTCREFPVFDLRARRRLALRERPLVVMEQTLLTHMALDEERAVAVGLRLREECRRVGGSFTLLWHNNLLASPRRRRAYLRLLDG